MRLYRGLALAGQLRHGCRGGPIRLHLVPQLQMHQRRLELRRLANVRQLRTAAAHGGRGILGVAVGVQGGGGQLRQARRGGNLGIDRIPCLLRTLQLQQGIRFIELHPRISGVQPGNLTKLR